MLARTSCREMLEMARNWLTAIVCMRKQTIVKMKNLRICNDY